MVKQFLLTATEETIARFASIFPEIQLLEVVGMGMAGSTNKILIHPDSNPQPIDMDLESESKSESL